MGLSRPARAARRGAPRAKDTPDADEEEQRFGRRNGRHIGPLRRSEADVLTRLATPGALSRAAAQRAQAAIAPAAPAEGFQILCLMGRPAWEAWYRCVCGAVAASVFWDRGVPACDTWRGLCEPRFGRANVLS